MEEQKLALETFLPYRLNRLAEQVSRAFSKIYRDRYGLMRPEWRTLATLGQFGRMTATAIGTHSAMHKTKVSRAVAELERRHWVTRTTDPSDRRIEHLELTKSGLAAYRDLVPIARAFEQKLLERMKPAETLALMEGLTALEKQLERRGATESAPVSPAWDIRASAGCGG